MASARVTEMLFYVIYKKYGTDPHWCDLVLFHEYFHGETGRGLGASHQTGWTALAARLLGDPPKTQIESNTPTKPKVVCRIRHARCDWRKTRAKCGPRSACCLKFESPTSSSAISILPSRRCWEKSQSV